MTTEIKQIILEKYFDPANGVPNEKEIKVSTAKFDESQTLEKGHIMIQLEYVSVDPYLRARLNGFKTFVDPFNLNEPINSGCVAKVIKSNDQGFKEGEHVSGYFNWQEKQIVKVTKEILKVDPNIAPLPSYVGVLGMTGVTAYFGLMKIGKPQKGETLVVTAAAGAVGSIVGQLGKIHGCRVVGIAGSDEKVKTLVNEFHFDVGLNYNSPTYEEDLKKACPKGVDIFFENVGGKVSDPILFLLNKHARMPVCGTISMYNKPANQDIGQRAQYFIFSKQALMQGFLVFDYSQEEYHDAFVHLSKWLKEGKIVNKQVLVNGFEQIIPSFLTIFDAKNKNIGKVVVKL